MCIYNRNIKILKLYFMINKISQRIATSRNSGIKFKIIPKKINLFKYD